MGDYIFLSLLLAFIGFTIYIIVKRQRFAKALAPQIKATRRSMFFGDLYYDESHNQSIFRYVVSGKVYYISSCFPEEVIELSEDCMIIDTRNKILCIIYQDQIIKKQRPKVIKLGDIDSVELFEDGYNSTKTRSGISPISINGYRIVSVTRKRVRKIGSIFLRITCKKGVFQKPIHLTLKKKTVETGTRAYFDLVDSVVVVKHKIDRAIERTQG